MRFRERVMGNQYRPGRDIRPSTGTAIRAVRPLFSGLQSRFRFVRRSRKRQYRDIATSASSETTGCCRASEKRITFYRLVKLYSLTDEHDAIKYFPVKCRSRFIFTRDLYLFIF